MGEVPIYERAIAEVGEQFDLARDYATEAVNLSKGLLESLTTIGNSIRQIDTNVTINDVDFNIPPFTATRPEKPVVDSFLDPFKRGNKIFPGFDLTFFPVAGAGESVVGNEPEKSDTSGNKGGYNLCFHMFILLILFSVPFWPFFCKEGDLLGVFIAFSQKHKFLKWLSYKLWSD